MTAAKLWGIPHDRLVLLGEPERVIPNSSGYNLHSLIEHGLSQEAKFIEIRAKTKVTLLLFSSGTTGKPKVRNSLP
jgi:acyl-coenzyme A synthetase/AMP-(fatty) acid ligase